ncbi:MAG: HAD-IIIA family hydrolase [Salibacteraceae bacterium]
MSYLDLCSEVRAFVFDVDGVLTNGHVILLPDGQQMRHMHSRDGYAIQLAVKQGYHVAIITGGNSPQVKERLNALGVHDIYMRASHKNEALEEFMLTYQLSGNQIAYMGDDIPDLSALKMVSLSSCPADAAEEVKEVCNYISRKKGGEGCVRDIIETVMRAQGKWFRADRHQDQLAEFTW